LESQQISRSSQIEIVSPLPVHAMAFAASIDGSEIFQQMAPDIHHPPSRTPSLDRQNASRTSTLELLSPVQTTSTHDEIISPRTAGSHQASSPIPSLETFVFPPPSGRRELTPTVAQPEQSHAITMSQSSTVSQVLVVNEKKMYPSTAIQLVS
jgi:hypothetical protein